LTGKLRKVKIRNSKKKKKSLGSTGLGFNGLSPRWRKGTEKGAHGREPRELLVGVELSLMLGHEKKDHPKLSGFLRAGLRLPRPGGGSKLGARGVPLTQIARAK